MSELISRNDAKLAWANGKKLQIANMIVGEDFYDIDDSNTTLNIFDLDFYQFRLKPRTITVNGIEVPAPADDKDYHHQGIWILNSLEPKEYSYVVLDITDELPRYWWKSEEEIQQVVAALSQVFGGSHDN